MTRGSYTPAALEVDADKANGAAVLRCSGEIDLSSVWQLERALAASVASGAMALEVDLRGVRYFDSSAIQALLRAHRALARDGRQLSVRAQPSARALLRVLRLDEVLQLHPD